MVGSWARSLAVVVTAAVAVSLVGPTGSASAQVAAPAQRETCSQASVTFDQKLVPSCGVLWGAAGAAFTGKPMVQAHHEFERTSGGVVPVPHGYYVGDQKFPNAAHKSLARESGKPRTLLLNWKPDTGTTFAAVAAGKKDARIDAAADYIKANFREKFFLAIHHEPDEEINQAAGSGMRATDYRNMFRHVVQRMRARGVSNMITVYNPMGYYGWITKPWFEDMYPGDDVVDWIAMDLYVQSNSTKARSLANMLNKQAGRTRYSNGATYQGAYNHMARVHPDKPLMLAEWGYQQKRAAPIRGDRAAFYRNVQANLADYPRLKAMVYFNDPVGESPTDVAESSDSLAAWRALSTDPRMVNPHPAAPVRVTPRSSTPDGPFTVDQARAKAKAKAKAKVRAKVRSAKGHKVKVTFRAKAKAKARATAASKRSARVAAKAKAKAKAKRKAYRKAHRKAARWSDRQYRR